jgi:hypothetical protein
VAQNGKPFRRIVIISHAGGATNGPALSLGTDRVAYDSTKRSAAERRHDLPYSLGRALSDGLLPGGILVLGSCGYYNDGDASYQKRWINNLRGFATAVNHTVYASPGPAEPSLLTGTNPLKNKDRDPGSMVGMTPPRQ